MAASPVEGVSLRGQMESLWKAMEREVAQFLKSVTVHDVLSGKLSMPERVAAEGASSPADVLMLVDVGTLMDVVRRGLTQPVVSPALAEAIPANLRDPAAGGKPNVKAKAFQCPTNCR